MSEKRVTFKKYHHSEANTHAFYMFPKQLMTDEYFDCLSLEAKVLYGYMLDRMSLSTKNDWVDENGNAFIYFSLDETMEAMKIGKNKALSLLASLDSETGIGLIERVKQGQGKPARIYVKDFIIEEDDSEVYKSNLKTFENQTSRLPENKPLEVSKSNLNNTDTNDNKYNNISNHFYSTSIEVHNEPELEENRSDERHYVGLIEKNIEWDILRDRYPHEQEILDGIKDLLVETVLSRTKTMVIARNEYDMELVRRKLFRLDTSHIEYVLQCLMNNSTQITNIRKYLLAVLFNAPSTIGSYYQARVNHDMPQMACNN